MNKFTNFLLGLFLLLIILYFGKGFFIPVIAGALLASLLLPIATRLEKWRIHRIISGLAGIFLVLSILVVVIVLVQNQVRSIAGDLPGLQEKVSAKLATVKDYIEQITGVDQNMQAAYIDRGVRSFFDSLGGYIRGFLILTTEFVFVFGLIMVFTFLFLLYRERLRLFVLEITSLEDRSRMAAILDQISHVANLYLAGVLIVVIILSVLNTLGLALIGIEHALFFGLLAGILNIIPYVGTITGSAIPMVFALVTKDSLWYVFAVGLMFLVIQLTESYFFTPKITGSKVKLNPLAVVSILLMGGYLWGIIGMILSLPLLGIVKVVCANIPSLRPYSFVLGKDGMDKQVDQKVDS